MVKKEPFFFRYSMIRPAITGPIPSKASSCQSVARLMLIGPDETFLLTRCPELLTTVEST